MTGTRGVHDFAATPSQFTEQRQCDHALAAARSTGDHNDRLVVTATSAFDGVEHRCVRKPLLGE